MNGADRLIFPGIVGGCISLILVAGLVTNPQIVLASTPEQQNVMTNPVLTLPENPNRDKHLPDVITDPDAIVDQNAGGGVSQASPAPAEPQPVQIQVQPVEPETGQAQPGCPLALSYSDAVRQWCDWIARYASENNLEPELLAALMTQESGGNPQAYSSSGAVGLMQIMPRDGLAASFMCVSGPCFASRPSIDELYNPEYNIAYGAQMLAGLIGKYGDVREALRAYGPHDVGYTYADIVMNIFNTYR